MTGFNFRFLVPKKLPTKAVVNINKGQTITTKNGMA